MLTALGSGLLQRVAYWLTGQSGAEGIPSYVWENWKTGLPVAVVVLAVFLGLAEYCSRARHRRPVVAVVLYLVYGFVWMVVIAWPGMSTAHSGPTAVAAAATAIVSYPLAIVYLLVQLVRRRAREHTDREVEEAA